MELKALWGILVGSYTIGFLGVIVWSAYFQYLITKHELKLKLITLLLGMQIAQAFFGIANAWAFYGDYMHHTSYRSTVTILCVFLLLLLCKHWIFSMKHWKVSNVLKEVLTQEEPPAFSKHGSVIFASLICISALLPLLICVCVYLHEIVAAKWLFRAWVGLFLISIVFLIDAYYRITANLKHQQDVRKVLMLW